MSLPRHLVWMQFNVHRAILNMHYGGALKDLLMHYFTYVPLACEVSQLPDVAFFSSYVSRSQIGATETEASCDVLEALLMAVNACVGI